MFEIIGAISQVMIGIHTSGLFHSCSYSDSQNLIELLKEKGHCWKIKCDAENINRTYFSDYFSEKGVLIYVLPGDHGVFCVNSLTGTKIRYVYTKFSAVSIPRIIGRSGIMLRITPCTLLNRQYAATELYRPTKENYRQLKSPLNKILKELGVQFKVDKMSVCRIDLCANIHFTNDKTTSQYLRVVKKYGEINHYKLVRYEKGSKIVKDAKTANENSYRISSRRASFTVYDKKFVLQQLERCPDELLDKGILRVEAELQREALLKRIHAKKGWSNYRILETAESKAKSILWKYLKQTNGGIGRHLRYCDAVDAYKRYNKSEPSKAKTLMKY